MRLSDAIGMGRMILEPASGGRGGPTKGCALQMAIAAEGKNDRVGWSRAAEIWPWLHKINPVTGESFLNGVWTKFDTEVMASDVVLKSHGLNRMTLDQLIDWVRSVEPAEEQIPVAQESHEAVTAKA